VWRDEHPAFDDEKIRRVGFRHEAVHVQHKRVVGPGHVRLNLGEDVVEQVAMVDLGVETRRRVAANGGGDKSLRTQSTNNLAARVD
jgi:hypothetical protein